MKREKRSTTKATFKINPNSKSNEIIKQYKLTTKLKNPEGKTAMITFKNMELVIMENNGKENKTIQKTKYQLGDMGTWKYGYAVKKYISKGYVLEGSLSNIDEVWKNNRKKQKGVENEELSTEATV
jgi:hypothetical protein